MSGLAENYGNFKMDDGGNAYFEKRERERRNRTMVNFDICAGNPGAFGFVMQAYEIDMFRAERAFQRMKDNGITGSRLYMLWNDCCDRDTRKALAVMAKMAVEEIVRHINYEGGRGIPITDEDMKKYA